ncbi:MAG: electron transfer flavoprotein subunit alpha/FixB family protein [Thermoplasmata archaeon]
MSSKEYEGVWIFLEQRSGRLRDVSSQLIGEGRRLADVLGVGLTGVLLGKDVAPLAQESIEYGLDEVVVVEHEFLEVYTPRPYTKVLAHLIEKYRPEIVLFGASKNGRDLGGRLHAVIHTGLAADCVGFGIDNDGNLDMIRPSFGGKSLAHILCKGHRPQMASVRPNVFKVPPRRKGRKGEILSETVELGPQDVDTRLVEFVEFHREDELRLEEADIILAGGFGLKAPKNFGLLEELAKELGGLVASSRKPVDSGWVPKDYQVGQTGRTVRPKLYVAVGISGAVQHLAGMQESEKIAAINLDPNAPIFEIADYGIVGDLFEVLPEMVRQIRARRGAARAEAASG